MYSKESSNELSGNLQVSFIFILQVAFNYGQVKVNVIFYWTDRWIWSLMLDTKVRATKAGSLTLERVRLPVKCLSEMSY